MRIVVDESMRGRVLKGLDEDGHDLLRIRVIAPRLPDREILALARRIGAVSEARHDARRGEECSASVRDSLPR
jgi:hypothetical protein